MVHLPVMLNEEMQSVISFRTVIWLVCVTIKLANS